MKGLFLVEPVVALYAFSAFLIYPLMQQYVYRRLWQQLTNTTYPISDNTSRCTDNSSNQSSYHEVSVESLDLKAQGLFTITHIFETFLHLRKQKFICVLTAIRVCVPPLLS